jgi:hypothetical protein
MGILEFLPSKEGGRRDSNPWDTTLKGSHLGPVPKTVPGCSHVLGSKLVLIVLDYSVERCKHSVKSSRIRANPTPSASLIISELLSMIESYGNAGGNRHKNHAKSSL